MDGGYPLAGVIGINGVPAYGELGYVGYAAGLWLFPAHEGVGTVGGGMTGG